MTEEKIVWERFTEWTKDKAFVNDAAFVSSWTTWKERQKEIDRLQETVINLLMARMRSAGVVKRLEAEVEQLKKKLENSGVG